MGTFIRNTIVFDSWQANQGWVVAAVKPAPHPQQRVAASALPSEPTTANLDETMPALQQPVVAAFRGQGRGRGGAQWRPQAPRYPQQQNPQFATPAPAGYRQKDPRGGAQKTKMDLLRHAATPIGSGESKQTPAEHHLHAHGGTFWCPQPQNTDTPRLTTNLHL